MAKLYFTYGTMKCGKSIDVQKVVYNFEEKGDNVILIKPAIDTRGVDRVVSRIGLQKKANILLKETDNIIDIFNDDYINNNIKCIVVDEAQFLSKIQIDQLYDIVFEYDIPVICYGLRIDFARNAFVGSLRLFELADEITELKTICSINDCSRKSHDNARKVNGEFTNTGDQVIIDNKADVEYVPLCSHHYRTLVEKKRK